MRNQAGKLKAVLPQQMLILNIVWGHQAVQGEHYEKIAP